MLYSCELRTKKRRKTTNQVQLIKPINFGRHTVHFRKEVKRDCVRIRADSNASTGNIRMISSFSGYPSPLLLCRRWNADEREAEMRAPPQNQETGLWREYGNEYPVKAAVRRVDIVHGWDPSVLPSSIATARCHSRDVLMISLYRPSRYTASIRMKEVLMGGDTERRANPQSTAPGSSEIKSFGGGGGSMFSRSRGQGRENV
jgi:hypothetical protein